MWPACRRITRLLPQFVFSGQPHVAFRTCWQVTKTAFWGSCTMDAAWIYGSAAAAAVLLSPLAGIIASPALLDSDSLEPGAPVGTLHCSCALPDCGGADEHTFLSPFVCASNEHTLPHGGISKGSSMSTLQHGQGGLAQTAATHSV